MIRKLLLMTMLIVSILFFPGCGVSPGPEELEGPEDINGEDIMPDEPVETPEEETEDPADPEETADPAEPDQVPDDIKAWIEISREKFQAQTRKDNGKLYILVTYGEKPTGGYSVEITGVEEKTDKLVVTANFTEPGPDDMVTQALTYPYGMVVIDDPNLPTVEFIATGAESSIPLIK